jgi:hypothetical protein
VINNSNVVNTTPPVFVRRKSGGGFFAVLAVLILIGFLMQHPVVLTIVLVALTVLVVGAIVDFVHKRREEAGRQIAARADAEYRASLEGNPAGTYGQYPPPVLPEPNEWPPPTVA